VYLVVIPSLGDPDLLVSCVRWLVRRCPAETLIVVALNPIDEEKAAETTAALARVDLDEGVSLTVTRVAFGPCGFAAAVNRGLAAGLAEMPHPDMVAIINDDIRPALGWLEGMYEALSTERVEVWSSNEDADGEPVTMSASDYGPIALVGPCSDVAAGIQGISVHPEKRAALHRDVDGFASRWRQANEGRVVTASYLSGFCLGVSGKALRRIAPDGHLFDERYTIGGFEDNDLCVRAARLGLRAVVAADVFVAHLGHQSLDRHFPGQARGLANRAAYYTANPPRISKRLAVIQRVALVTGNDLHVWRASIQRAAEIADVIVVAVERNPFEITRAPDWEASSKMLWPDDATMLQACDGADLSDTLDPVLSWCESMVASVGGRADVVHLPVSGTVERQWSEAVQTAANYEADWAIVLETSEVLEEGVTRDHLDRLMAHPDPLVSAWDLAHVSLWDSPRLRRVDPPFADGYAGEAHGVRMFRLSPGLAVVPSAPGQVSISPAFDPHARRCAGIRLRSHALLRSLDRHVETKRAAHRGTDASHLMAEERIALSAWNPRDRIGLTMLAYSGESTEDVARHLDQLYGLVDAIVVAWTDEAEPSERWVELFTAWGVAVIRHPLADDIAAARNAGLDALQAAGCDWAWVVDPDESASDPWGVCLALRRMAESADSVGFTVLFENQRHPSTREAPAASDTIRFVRLNPAAPMRYAGRVHETFDRACWEMHEKGIRPNVRTAPFSIRNRGLALDDYGMEAKLRRYQRLLLLEVADHPENAGAWVSLGLQYANDGRLDLARACYLRGQAVAGKSYLPFHQLAQLHMQEARELTRQAVDRLSPAHRLHKPLADTVKALGNLAPGMAVAGLARVGPVPESSIPPLPPWPEHMGPDPALSR